MIKFTEHKKHQTKQYEKCKNLYLFTQNHVGIREHFILKWFDHSILKSIENQQKITEYDG